MFQIPTWAIKSTPESEMDALLEWRLSAADVASLLERGTTTIWRWANAGRKGIVLESRRFASDPHSPQAFRLSGVEDFAAVFDLRIDYGALHPALSAAWKVGPNGQKGHGHD